VDHPQVRDHLATLGTTLDWHGPLALDYLYDPATGRPTYIEANPRLVEPMNATLSGVNLAELTVRVALGEIEASDGTRTGRFGVRSHSLLAILLGVAAHGRSRRDLLRTIGQALAGRGIFEDSREDLTPGRTDPPSLLALGVVTGQLLLRPSAAGGISSGAVDAYSLNADAVETILALPEPQGTPVAGG
jgi:hypothetical protein